MLRSLYTGISGLRAHQTMMDVTGNNIANVNTTGYKSANTVFEDTLSQTLANGTQPQGQNGGTNPAQVGLGVRVAGITTNFTQGATQTTGRNTDMLIGGDGFFISKSGGTESYTRNGSFSLDANGSLVSSAGGFLQGWTADAGGNVDTTGKTSEVAIPVSTLLPPKATETLTATGNLNALTPDGTTKSFTYSVYDTSGTPIDITLNLTPKTRSAGAASPVTEWTAEASFKGTTIALDDVTFDATGVLQNAPAELDLGDLTGTNGVDFPVKVDISKITGSSMGTANADSTIKISAADGYGAAALKAWKVGGDGTITGTFDNGESQTLGRIAIAMFNNPAGLEKQGGSLYAASVNSGNAAIGIAGADGRGTLTTGALEMSNVDLAQEFTNLIVSQRGFQANSRVITSSDEMLQELVNLKR